MIKSILIAENKEKDLMLLVEDAGPELGYYLYVMRISSGEIFKDHLCDDMDQIYRKSEKDYNVKPSEFSSPNNSK